MSRSAQDRAGSGDITPVAETEEGRRPFDINAVNKFTHLADQIDLRVRSVVSSLEELDALPPEAVQRDIALVQRKVRELRILVDQGPGPEGEPDLLALTKQMKDLPQGLEIKENMRRTGLLDEFDKETAAVKSTLGQLPTLSPSQIWRCELLIIESMLREEAFLKSLSFPLPIEAPEGNLRKIGKPEDLSEARQMLAQLGSFEKVLEAWNAHRRRVRKKIASIPMAVYDDLMASPFQGMGTVSAIRYMRDCFIKDLSMLMVRIQIIMEEPQSLPFHV